MCGEYAFEAKFQRRDELHEETMERCRQFFIELQQSGRDWLSRMNGNEIAIAGRVSGRPPSKTPYQFSTILSI
jgi:hypothetical protein